MIPFIIGESFRPSVRFEECNDRVSQDSRVSTVSLSAIKKICSDSTMCNAFLSTAENSNKTDKEKREIVRMTQESLDEPSHQRLCASIAKLHPWIAAPILRYSRETVWEDVVRKEESFKWIQEAINNTWPMEEKLSFLNRLFQVPLCNNPKEPFYYFMLQAPLDLQNRLLEIVPDFLKQSIQELQRDLELEGNFFLDLFKRSRLMELPPLKYERRVFLAWLHSHALSHERVCLLALILKKEDLVYFKNINPSFFLSLIVPWTRNLSSFNSSYNAKKFLDGAFALLSDEELGAFAKLLTVQDLSDLSLVFSEMNQKKLTKHMCEQELEKMIGWIIHLSEDPDYEKNSKILSQQFSFVSILFHPNLLEKIFQLESNNTFVIYGCLSIKDKEYMLRSAFSRSVGLSMLSSWIYLCLFAPVDLNTMLGKQFSQNLPVLLNKIDPQIVPILRSQILKNYLDVPLSEKFFLVDFLFPSDLAFENQVIDAFEKLARMQVQGNREESEAFLFHKITELLSTSLVDSPFALVVVLQKFIESRSSALLVPLLRVLSLYHEDDKAWSQGQWMIALEMAIDRSEVDKFSFLVTALFTQPKVLGPRRSAIESCLWKMVQKTFGMDRSHNHQNQFLYWVRFLCASSKTTAEKLILFQCFCVAHKQVYQNILKWLCLLEPKFFYIIKEWYCSEGTRVLIRTHPVILLPFLLFNRGVFYPLLFHDINLMKVSEVKIVIEMLKGMSIYQEFQQELLKQSPAIIHRIKEAS